MKFSDHMGQQQPRQWAFAVMLVLTATVAWADQASQAQIENAWIREGPPTQTNGAGFVTLTNSGDDSLALMGAQTPAANSVELHTMTMNDGQMSMRRVLAIEVEAGEQRDLSAHGEHLMLLGLTDPLARGDRVPITLIFADDSSTTVDFEVKAN